MNPKLSIVIPCYNMGDFAQEAIDSVLDYPNQNTIEIIAVNDGSNDDNHTKNILDSYKNSNITIIHQENQGLGAARNNGIALAKAAYVLPLDADNKIRPDYITKGCAILDKYSDVGLVYGDLKRFDEEIGNVEVGAFDISKLLQKNYIDACVVLRKAAWSSVKGYDEAMPVMGYEDWDFNLRLFFKGWHFYYVHEVLYEYRVRENSMLVTSNNNKELLVDYMFSKAELLQAKYLRDKILDANIYEEELINLKKRKVINAALKLEKPIKSIYKILKK